MVPLFRWRGRVTTRVGGMFHLDWSDIFRVTTVESNEIEVVGGRFWGPEVAIRRKKWKIIEGRGVCRGWEISDVILKAIF